MKRGRIRLVALITAVVVAGGLCCLRLLEYQVANGDAYLEQAGGRTISEVKVNAARGKIVDRYGVELVTNKAGFNLVFDRAYFEKGKENETILALTKILEEAGEEWLDELPLSASEPFAFLPGTEDEVGRMRDKLGMQSYATAEECMAEIVRQFDLESYSGKELRTLAGVRYSMFARDFSIYNRYTFAEDVSTETVAAIEELGYKYPGVNVSTESIREYGEGKVLPHVIGTMSAIFPDEAEDYLAKGYALNERVGRSGIEGVMESELRGVPGTIRVEQNNYGKVISSTVAEEPVAGNSVMLTIDSEFQLEVQSILEDFIFSLHARRERGKDVTAGAIVVLDATNGEVLAAATYPTYQLSDLFDPERNAELENDPLEPKKNRAFREIYRPGSTFKTVTATGALSEGVITESDTVTCGGIYWYDPDPDGYHPKCTGHHGTINVVSALKFSCNIFFYDVGRRLGIAKLNEYAAKLGLGQDTGLEIGNARGQVASPELSAANGETWYNGNTWQAAIGQSDTKVTPLQLAIQAMTIANKGTRYAAHIIKSVNSYDLKETVRATEPEILSELSGKDEVFEIVQHGMRETANRRLTMVGLEGGAAIKTGTPQLTQTEYNSATVGFYPALTSPEISFGAVLEGGEYSADMMAEVINAYNAFKAKRAGRETSYVFHYRETADDEPGETPAG